jgi:MoxR-like ATPase
MNKIKEIQETLNKKYFEREKEIEGLLVALLAKQHVLFIGDAGTGKSQLSSELGNIVEDSNYFQWLLSQFSTPEELFGVLSLKELEQGVYKRNTNGKLPEAHFAFLDEIFKANSAILNSLLTLINERLFYNNGSPIKTPLMSIVGSSNEYPEEGEGLEALFDRFLLRYEISYIREEKSFISLLKGENDVKVPTITLQELEQAQQEVQKVSIPNKVIETLSEIRQALNDEGIRPSDRRFVQSLSLLKAKAYIENRTNVILRDIEILKHSLWVSPEQSEKELVSDIIYSHSVDMNEQILVEREKESKELIKMLYDENLTLDEKLEIINKLKKIKNDVENLSLEDDTVKNNLINTVTNEIGQFVSNIVDF